MSEFPPDRRKQIKLVKHCSRRLVLRLFYLQHFFKVCAWCHKVGINKTWMTLSEFLDQEFKPTHGICPECAKTLMSDELDFPPTTGDIDADKTGTNLPSSQRSQDRNLCSLQ